MDLRERASEYAKKYRNGLYDYDMLYAFAKQERLESYLNGLRKALKLIEENPNSRERFMKKIIDDEIQRSKKEGG